VRGLARKRDFNGKIGEATPTKTRKRRIWEGVLRDITGGEKESTKPIVEKQFRPMTHKKMMSKGIANISYNVN